MQFCFGNLNNADMAMYTWVLSKFNSLDWQYLKTQYLLYQGAILKGKRKLQRRQNVTPYGILTLMINWDCTIQYTLWKPYNAGRDVSRQKMLTSSKFRRLYDAVIVNVHTGEKFIMHQNIQQWLGKERVQERKQCNSA
jgi:hypothetical protein